MIAIVDVHYDDAAGTAAAGAVVAAAWTDADARATHRVVVPLAAPYVPGQLYRRELPPLLAVLAELADPLEVVVVDGHAWLGPDRPGLGVHLHRALDGRVAVVGVAKNEFVGAPARPLVRGDGARPLWISAVGLTDDDAAARIASMHGPHRLPTLLVQADHVARGLP
ncbi:MAG: endonuclease V [Kofleriaceae bacterium]|nr:endonuclease V [Myxococcales bacterium]MCB9565091.1 endonuclease V [Kofleriaceae bacterium]